MPPSPLLKKTLQRNHDRSNTTTFDAILTSLMAPLTISTMAEYPSAEAVPLQQLVGNEFDALIEWFASSSSSSGSALVSMPDSCEPVDYNDAATYGKAVGVDRDRNGSGEYDPLRPGFSLLKPSPLDAVPSSRFVGGGGKVHYMSTENRALGMEKEKDAEGYDPSNPKLSLPMMMLMRGRERGAYPLPSDPTPPHSRPSLPAPSLPPIPLGPAVTAPRSSSSSITPTPRCPGVSTSSPLPTSQLLLPSSASANIANLPLATERGKPQWKGDRRRLDAMKQRRIEERRERRGRDPITGANVAVVEGGKLFKAKGTKKGKGEKVASGRVGKVWRRQEVGNVGFVRLESKREGPR
ncbi:MAG: hypothetical protein Q9192_005421 [Flavoplaca navasiana]